MTLRPAGGDVTLQINLAGGDLPYAEHTVPALAEAHRAHVREVVLVVDCCRPQRTQMVEPDVKFPAEVFRGRAADLRVLAERLLRSGVADRVVFVEPGDPRIRRILRKYVGRVVSETHDCYGCGLVSYLVGFDEATTRYLLHYDADMLLYQAPHYDWSVEGVTRLQRDPRAISVTPRVSPPFAEALGRPDAPSLQASDPPPLLHDGAWRVGWFSARCFLLDLERLRGWLPLLSPWSVPGYFAEVVARRWLVRGYPPPTELLIHKRAQSVRSYRLDLTTTKAFVVHPNEKGPRFLALLPEILARVRADDVPHGQRGWENLVLDAWTSVLAEPAVSR